MRNEWEDWNDDKLDLQTAELENLLPKETFKEDKGNFVLKADIDDSLLEDKHLMGLDQNDIPYLKQEAKQTQQGSQEFKKAKVDSAVKNGPQGFYVPPNPFMAVPMVVSPNDMAMQSGNVNMGMPWNAGRMNMGLGNMADGTGIKRETGGTEKNVPMSMMAYPMQGNGMMMMPFVQTPFMVPGAMMPHGNLPPHVPIAKKQQGSEPSATLQVLIQEEREKKERKLDKNRNSARTSRTRKLNVVESLENAVKDLQMAMSVVVQYQWGTCDDINKLKRLTLDEAYACQPKLSQIPAHVHIRVEHAKNNIVSHSRLSSIETHFNVIAGFIARLRTHALNASVLHAVANSSDTNGPSTLNRLADMLQLTELQKLEINKNQQEIQRIARNIAILTKLVRVIRAQGMTFAKHSPSLDKHLIPVATLKQVTNLCKWSIEVMYIYM